MDQVNQPRQQSTLDGPPGPSRTWRGWAGLLISLALLGLFFAFGHKGLELSFYKPIAQFIEERGIQANAYYYTEVEEFAEAGVNLRTTMTYPPGRYGQKYPD